MFQLIYQNHMNLQLNMGLAALTYSRYVFLCRHTFHFRMECVTQLPHVVPDQKKWILKHNAKDCS